MHEPQTDPKAVIYGFLDAMNRLDLEGMLKYIDKDYESEGMLPPEWQFQGRDRVRENWKDLPHRKGFRAEIHGCVCEGNEVWGEWNIFTPNADDSVTEIRGIIINEVRNEQIIRGRFYVARIEHPVSTEQPD